METLDKDKIVVEIWENQKYFYAIIARRIIYCLNPTAKQWIGRHFDDSVPEIFMKSFNILHDKYFPLGKIHNYSDARKLLARICYLQTYKYCEKYIDEQWYRRMSRGNRNIPQYPPSYYYHKKYWKENAERINEQRRENYKNDKNGVATKAKLRNKLRVQATTAQIIL